MLGGIKVSTAVILRALHDYCKGGVDLAEYFNAFALGLRCRRKF